ncbi:hypothetical protein [Caballeronia sp. 15715]|uniref:hypothetical protein n=1 Tax=unclassified Caballeronia TaxID=2646786 RepID=UPI0039E41377
MMVPEDTAHFVQTRSTINNTLRHRQHQEATRQHADTEGNQTGTHAMGSTSRVSWKIGGRVTYKVTRPKSGKQEFYEKRLCKSMSYDLSRDVMKRPAG